MSARNARKVSDIIADLDIDLDGGTDDVVIATTDDEVATVPVSNRKYMTHATCGHATKGDAGKAARAMCRRNVRAWLNAEAEFLATVAA